jgi:hypothetical protein
MNSNKTFTYTGLYIHISLYVKVYKINQLNKLFLPLNIWNVTIIITIIYKLKDSDLYPSSRFVSNIAQNVSFKLYITALHYALHYVLQLYIMY